MIAHIGLIYFPRHVGKHSRFCLHLSLNAVWSGRKNQELFRHISWLLAAQKERHNEIYAHKKNVLSEKSTEKLLAKKLGRQNWSWPSCSWSISLLHKSCNFCLFLPSTTPRKWVLQRFNMYSKTSKTVAWIVTKISAQEEKIVSNKKTESMAPKPQRNNRDRSKLPKRFCAPKSPILICRY